MGYKKTMTTGRIFLLISVFLLILTSFRIGWIHYHKTPDHPHAEKGVIDLSEWNFTDNQTITLDGEWEFYPNQFLSPDYQEQKEGKEFITVPSDWADALVEKEKISTFGYGTYRLKVILPKDEKQLFGLRMKSIKTAANVYIDGILVEEFGTPATSANHSEGKQGPFATYFQPESNEIELIIQVSNFDDPIEGGINKSIQIGSESAISKEEQGSKTLQIIVSLIYFLHSIYAFIIYYLGKRKYQKEVLFFGVMLILHGFTILIDDDIVLHLPIDYMLSQKLLLVLFISTLMVLLIFIKHFFKQTAHFYKVLFNVFIILFLVTIMIPTEYMVFLSIFYAFFYSSSILFLFFQTMKVVSEGDRDAIFILLFITSYTSNMIWGGLINSNLVEIPYYPFDFLVSIIAIVLILFRRQVRLFQDNEQYTLELKKVDKKKDEFLANTSHELRNPLHGIINIAYSLLNDEAESLTEKNRRNLKLLIRVGQRMSFTLNDLLDSSRLKEDQIKLKRQPVNLHSVASGVLDMMYFMTDKKNVQIKLNIPATFPPVYADQNRLIQILFNLFHNAVKYTNEGTITIDATYKKRIATVAVADTGIGISEQALKNIFHPYKQENEGAEYIEGGFGLGLSICKQLVQLHGGKISAESIVGEGTVIYFTIPLADDGEISKEANSNLEVAATKGLDRFKTPELPAVPMSNEVGARILVVDDDPVNLNILQSLLEADYKVTTAMDSEEALKLLDTGEWDLIIADVMMPNMSGYELTQKIRKQFTISELPILLLTARAQQEDIYAGFRSGANDYVLKPVDPLELKARVKALTELKKSVHEQLKMEAAWLQAQIQPHFLFNTLNTIASLGVIEPPKMFKLLEEFGNYLRRSFAVHNTESLISIEDELELTRSYLYIVKARFGDRLQTKCEIEEECDFKVPPLSIQPIVENAVEHGILKRIEGGTVRIQITCQEKYYNIAIIDDGIGMEQEEIEKLLTEHPSQVTGVGLANTNRRLKKLYGKGLTIESKREQGTTVSFEIPKDQ